MPSVRGRWRPSESRSSRPRSVCCPKNRPSPSQEAVRAAGARSPDASEEATDRGRGELPRGAGLIAEGGEDPPPRRHGHEALDDDEEMKGGEAPAQAEGGAGEEMPGKNRDHGAMHLEGAG